MVAPAVPEYVFPPCPRVPESQFSPRGIWLGTDNFYNSRIYEEEDIYAAIDARTESLQSLRELGPPDLIYLVKQPKANANRQVRIDTPGFGYHLTDRIGVTTDWSLPSCCRNRRLILR